MTPTCCCPTCCCDGGGPFCRARGCTVCLDAARQEPAPVPAAA